MVSILLMKDNVVNKKKKGSTNKKKRSNKASMSPKNAKQQTSTIGINIGKDNHMDNDKENDDFMEYEFAVRQNPDLEIQEMSYSSKFNCL